MTRTEENALMLAKTISTFKGKTSAWLKENIDWLKMYSVFGIDHWLHYAEKKGYVRSEDKDGELIYFSTTKGLREYNRSIH